MKTKLTILLSLLTLTLFGYEPVKAQQFPRIEIQQEKPWTGCSRLVLTTRDLGFAMGSGYRYENTIQILDIDQPWPPLFIYSTGTPSSPITRVLQDAKIIEERMTFWEHNLDTTPFVSGYHQMGIDGQIERSFDILGADPHDFQREGELILAPVKTYQERDIRAFTGLPADSAVTVTGSGVKVFRGDSLIFYWDALNHLPLDETPLEFFIPSTDGYDLHHINSARWAGNDILISLRNTSALYRIDTATGTIIWRYGGKYSDFPLGPEDSLHLQHDAEFIEYGAYGTHLSVFDNGNPDHVARARIILLDEAAMAAVDAVAYAADSIYSQAMGSQQVLLNGSMVVNYGIHLQMDKPNAVLLNYDLNPAAEIYLPEYVFAYKIKCADDWADFPRPVIRCSETPTGFHLEAIGPHSAWRWMNGDTNQAISISGAESEIYVQGRWGAGWAGSQLVDITSCSGVSIEPYLDQDPLSVKQLQGIARISSAEPVEVISQLGQIIAQGRELVISQPGIYLARSREHSIRFYVSR